MLSYQGSKRREILNILEVLPQSTIFVDVFGGAGNVCFDRRVQAKTSNIHYNDADPMIYKLALAYQSGSLPVLSLPYTDANYERIEKEFKHATSTLDHYLWLKSVAFRGVIGRGLMNKTNGVIKSTRTIINQKINVPPNARITNLDYKKILEEYKDNPEAVLYCDPPYCNSALSSLHNDEYGGITLNKNCLEDLCEFAKTATCKVMIHVPMDGYMYLLARDNPILKISTCYPLNYNANKDKTRLVHHCILQNF